VPNNDQGALASNQGKILEQTVESTFERKGFEVLMYRDWEKHPDQHSGEVLLKNCPFTNIYNHDGNTEFLVISERKNCKIRIECKWQQSSGSVDEKFPYLYLNCIDAMPENHIIIIVDGGGARLGAVEWLKTAAKDKKYTTDDNKDKTVEVFTLSEFIQWANVAFR
jgi:hypothetical protein